MYAIVFFPSDDTSDYLEVFVTMGTIELSLYAVDDSSVELVALRPPTMWKKHTSEPVTQVKSQSRL